MLKRGQSPRYCAFGRQYKVPELEDPNHDPKQHPMGISPSQSERQREQARLQTLQRDVEALLNDAFPPDTAHLAEVPLEPVQGTYVVRATIYNYGNWDDTEIVNSTCEVRESGRQGHARRLCLCPTPNQTTPGRGTT